MGMRKTITVTEDSKRAIAMMAGGLGMTEAKFMQLVTPMLQAAFNRAEMSIDSFGRVMKAAEECIAKNVTFDNRSGDEHANKPTN